MKCAVCNCKTTYDTSVGRDAFIVCYGCYSKIAKMENIKKFDVLSTILAIGTIKEEEEQEC